ncbi:MAG TPA: 4-hydroxythreonine-4-phosphate dehydrogenase [Thiotrichaceae bacterium]|jgi:4-hydroxythreonine-4-phosphate dehydrogenase|nr:4-hydroxythreonine-4-phosphate dehydrogenase [Thiotrichaceae bacterium]HIM08017.1 4-hydroxythreonine-4-phosphate dehydrogenase [Gammaproteobacteria bacterium]
MNTNKKPIIATMIGDPCGIGPEVIAKAWATGEVHEYSTPVLIGSAQVMERAVGFSDLKLPVRKISKLDEITDSADVIDILDSGKLDINDVTLGEDNAACGKVSADWLDEADKLALSGEVAGTIMGPISSVAMKMAGVEGKVFNIKPGLSYLFLISGSLRVMHLTDHISLREVCELVSSDLVFNALQTMDSRLKEWGIKSPRIGVSGLNPHAYGEEEKNEIIPGISRAKESGINVEGPVAPDTIFRQCIDDKYDAVLAMFHDQGHIAIKTWGFVGNCALMVGPPYLHMSVAHGTAYDIVGKGIASHEMILTAMKMTGNLAAGNGFL